MKYYYKIYGLIIRSEVKLEEAVETDEEPYDVDITYGETPAHIREHNTKEVRGLISGEYKWFRYDDIGEFYIEKGTHIIADIKRNAEEKVIRSILLGPCFGSILHQRKIFALHGSAMVWEDKAVIISGESGAGKSTVATALRKRGWSFLADDTVAVTYEDGLLYANPAYPQQKLCLDTVIEFGFDTEQLTLISEERQKYALKINDAFCTSKREIQAMICLELNDMEQLVIDEITGNAKLEYIIKNLYTFYDFKYMGMNTSDFTKCLEFARKIPMLRVKRPPHEKTLDQIIESVMSRIVIYD